MTLDKRRSKNDFFNVGARFSWFYDGFGLYRILRLCPL
ncbi:hypothetical protein [Klebsiella phage vB_KpnS-VAC51]|uniref:Uncharacterized protein n=1 Tax=Klebsiella phage vB_KpnS-VAC51 TaxID=2866698 RepID=A0AAE8YDX0_9CAUD|nr:hypothetical protein [Klebsiella phage vB_KpnS-VAC51]